MIKLRNLWIVLVIFSFNVLSETEYRDKIDYFPVPSWVQWTDYEASVAKHDVQSSVSYFLVDSQLNLAKNQHEDYFRIVQRINNKQGLNQASEIYFHFNPDYQRLVIHNVKVIRNGEEIDQTKTELNTMKQEQDLSSRILTGYVTALAILTDIQEGDIVDYAYSVIGSNPVFNGKKFAMMNTSWPVDVNKAKVVVVTDKATPLNHQVTGSEVTITTLESDTHITYHWEDDNIAAEANEHNYPNWYQLFDSVEFSEFDNWQEVANWAVELYNFNVELDEELIAMNKQWHKSSQNPQEYVKKVVSFVQNDIRYFGLELAENSHKPRHPNEVFSRRYGDCKDKALMISGLLQQYDIPSWSALVSANTHEGVTQRLPSPGAFDHVINKIILDNQTFWIDGTNSGQYGDLSSFSTNQFGAALLVDRNSKKLDDMNEVAMVSWQNHWKETFYSIGYEQPVSMDFRIALTGQEAQQSRITIEQEGKEYIENNILDYYKRQFSSSEWKSELVINDDKAVNSIEMLGTIAISDYWQLQNDQFEVPLYGENLSSYLALPEQINRLTPLANFENIEVMHEVSMKLHENIDWDLHDNNVKIATDAFRYERNVNAIGNLVTVKHLYKPVARFIKTEQISEHVDTIKKARDDLYFSIVISNQQSDKNELRNKMRSLLKL